VLLYVICSKFKRNKDMYFEIASVAGTLLFSWKTLFCQLQLEVSGEFQHFAPPLSAWIVISNVPFSCRRQCLFVNKRPTREKISSASGSSFHLMLLAMTKCEEITLLDLSPTCHLISRKLLAACVELVSKSDWKSDPDINNEVRL